MQEVLGLDPTGIAGRRKQELYMKEAQEYRTRCDLARTISEPTCRMSRSEARALAAPRSRVVCTIEIVRGGENRIFSILIGLNRA